MSNGAGARQRVLPLFPLDVTLHAAHQSPCCSVENVSAMSPQHSQIMASYTSDAQSVLCRVVAGGMVLSLVIAPAPARVV